MTIKRTTIWYVNPHGNEVTNRVLSETLDAEHECHHKMCADGRPRHLWRLDSFETIGQLQEFKKTMDIRFDIFVQEGLHGLPRLWDLRKSRISRREGRKVGRFLAKAKARLETKD